MHGERIKHFISDSHKKIDGWFFPFDQVAFFELFSMQNQKGIQGDVAEVGVYKGKSLVFLSLLKSEGEQLYGFDLFEQDFLKITEDNLRDYGSTKGVLLRKGLTSDLAPADLDSIISSPVRFLHIDAGHEYHEVLEQLQLFSPYVAENGIIAMDDYQDREFPGIEAAVLDFAERDRPLRFVPFLAGGNKMFLCPSTLSNLFQRLLLQRPNFTDSCRLTRVRDFNILVMRSKLPVPSEKIIAQLTKLDFPRRSDFELSLKHKSARFSQISFGSGE